MHPSVTMADRCCSAQASTKCADPLGSGCLVRATKLQTKGHKAPDIRYREKKKTKQQAEEISTSRPTPILSPAVLFEHFLQHCWQRKQENPANMNS